MVIQLSLTNEPLSKAWLHLPGSHNNPLGNQTIMKSSISEHYDIPSCLHCSLGSIKTITSCSRPECWGALLMCLAPPFLLIAWEQYQLSVVTLTASCTCTWIVAPRRRILNVESVKCRESWNVESSGHAWLVEGTIVVLTSSELGQNGKVSGKTHLSWTLEIVILSKTLSAFLNYTGRWPTSP